MTSLFTDLDVTRAVRATILGSGVAFPQTTIAVSHAVLAGDASITVTSATGFRAGGELWFEDGTTEEAVPIANVTGNVITPDWASTDHSGFQLAHAAGAKLSSNLLEEVPNTIDEMIAYGDPLVFVMILKEETYQADSSRVRPLMMAHVEYRRVLHVPPGMSYDTNWWSRRQQKQARADLRVMEDALLHNPTLLSDYTPQVAEGFGDGSGSRPLVTKDWNKIVIDATTFQFMASTNYVIRAKRRPTF